MTAAANILVGVHAVMNSDRSASRQQLIDTALGEITQLRERLESLQQPEISVDRAEALRHANVLQNRLNRARLVDWAHAARQGGRSARRLADRVWLVPPTTQPESGEVQPHLSAHLALVTALTVPNAAVVVTGELINMGPESDPQPQLAAAGEPHRPYLPVPELLDLFFSTPVNSRTNSSAGGNEPSVLVLMPYGTDEELRRYAREVAEVVETRQVIGLPAPRAVVVGSPQPNQLISGHVYPHQSVDLYVTLLSAVQDASRAAVPRDLETEIRSRLDEGHSWFDDYNLALLVVTRRIEEERQEQDGPPAYRALLSPLAPSASMESQRFVAVPLGAGVVGTGAVGLDAARGFLRVRTVLPVAPPGSAAMPVRLGENITSYRLRLPSVGDEPAREVFTLWADADEIWVNQYRTVLPRHRVAGTDLRQVGQPGLVAVMVPNHGVFAGFAEVLHSNIAFNALEQVVVEPGRLNRAGVLPGVAPYSRLRSPVDGQWLTAQEYLQDLVPTPPVGLRPVVLLVDPLTGEAQRTSPFIQHLVQQHVSVVSAEYARPSDEETGSVEEVLAWRVLRWSESRQRTRRSEPSGDISETLTSATRQPPAMSLREALTRFAAAPTDGVSHADPAAATVRWAFRTTPELEFDAPIAVEFPVPDREAYLRWLEQPAGVAAVQWAEEDGGGYTSDIQLQFLRGIALDSDQYFLVDTVGLAAWERERTGSPFGITELTESPDQDDSEDDGSVSPPHYDSLAPPGGRASTVFAAMRPPADGPPDYGWAGAGPAGEFTEVIASGLDDV
ncbi:hypothetical protein ACIBF5_32590, partial [Micromonospora sp. NPDC050417]|uniref:hypothetical protein n=1 Tax=Micromonospora sp. NPDC050417 TaxID=3364280 RepID=UPI0037A0B176